MTTRKKVYFLNSENGMEFFHPECLELASANETRHLRETVKWDVVEPADSPSYCVICDGRMWDAELSDKGISYCRKRAIAAVESSACEITHYHSGEACDKLSYCSREVRMDPSADDVRARRRGKLKTLQFCRSHYDRFD